MAPTRQKKETAAFAEGTMRYALVMVMLVGCAAPDLERGTEDAAIGAVPMGAAKKKTPCCE